MNHYANDQESTMNLSLKLPVLCAVTGALFALAGNGSAHDLTSSADQAGHHASRVKPSPLVDKVRAATRRYKNIDVALAEGWVPATPCVSGPNSGAMGVHYVLPDRVGDAVLSADVPEALIYEPLTNGRLRLVGVEFIVLADVWNTANPDAQPALDGHLLNLVSEPNRYRLPAFYELHVWAWERNPNGNFADWNSQVTCDQQPNS
jgi:hypothetical protein